jgi:Fibroblast growth factor
VFLQPQFSEECIFRENIGLDHYNTYTSVRYSNSKKTLYMGLDGRGLPRRVQVPTLRHKRQFQLPPVEAVPGGKLGRLATYARVLPRHVAPSRVDELAHRLLLQRQRLQLEASGAGGGGSSSSGDDEVALRHHGIAHLCPAPQGLVTPATPRRPRKCTGRVGMGAGGGGGKGVAAAKKQQPKRKKKCSEEEDIEKCKRERKLRTQRLKRKKQQQTGPRRGQPPAAPPSLGPKKGNGPKAAAKKAAVAQKKNAPKRPGAGGRKRTTTTPSTIPPTLATLSTTPVLVVVTPTSLVSTGGSD